MRVPLEQVGVKGEETVQGVGVGSDTVPSSGAAYHWQHLTVVSLNDAVAENHLILPGKQRGTDFLNLTTGQGQEQSTLKTEVYTV